MFALNNCRKQSLSVIFSIILSCTFFCTLLYSLFSIQSSTYASEAEIFSVTAQIEDNYFRVGEHVLLENQTISENIYAMGNTIELRNVEIKNNAKIYAHNIILQENVKIQGNFTYAGDIQIPNSNDSLETMVHGVITQENTEMPNYSFMNIVYNEHNKAIFLIYLISIIFCAFVLFRFIPKYFSNTIQNIRSHILSSFLWGASFIITAPLISFILCITIIGFPFGITLLSIWLLSLFLFPYLLTSTGTAFFLTVFKWEGFFATLVVTVLSAILSIMIVTSPIVLIIAPFVFGAMIKKYIS